MKKRGASTFIAWAPASQRQRDLAAAVGGVAKPVWYPKLAKGKRVPLRYLLSGLATVGHLVKHRPQAVVTQNPPVFPGIIAWTYSVVTGASFVLDSHPSSFGAKDNKWGKRFLGVHHFLARRAAIVLVCAEPWAAQVRDWGATALVLHEAPPEALVAPRAPRPRPASAFCLFVCLRRMSPSRKSCQLRACSQTTKSASPGIPDVASRLTLPIHRQMPSSPVGLMPLTTTVNFVTRT